jgi:chemotaxis signal transduction protein
MIDEPHWAAIVAQLRRDFDDIFAAPPLPDPPMRENLLAIGVGDLQLAIRFSALSRLVHRQKIAPLVGREPNALLGLAGIRGHLVAVFSLARLLEAQRAPSEEGEHESWVVLTTGEEPVGLAFERFDGYLHVEQSAIRRLEEPPPAPFIEELLVGPAPFAPRFVLNAAAIPPSIARSASASKRSAECPIVGASFAKLP